MSSKTPAWVQIVLIPFIFELMVEDYKINLAFSDIIELFDQNNQVQITKLLPSPTPLVTLLVTLGILVMEVQVLIQVQYIHIIQQEHILLH